jgi:hypothetical protein
MGETRHLEADHQGGSIATRKPRLEGRIERAWIHSSNEVDVDADHVLPSAARSRV